MDIFANLGIGFINAVQPLNFLMIIVGLLIGIVAGALPGITMINSIVLVLPFTYLMGIVPALLLMIGVYCGGVFGGSITGILFNIPGDPMNVPTTWEGYRLNRQGKTQYALGLAIMSSAFGGLVSALCLAFFAPPFAKFALRFSSVEFFSVVVFGLASVSVLGGSSMIAALISLFAGMFLGTIGPDAMYGVERFGFGVPFLSTGVDFVTVLIGLFAIGEVIEQLVILDPEPIPDVSVKRAIPRLPFQNIWPLRWPLIRGTAVGLTVGGLAGAGATVSSFVSYGLEKQVSKTPELFGKGHAGGLVASESSVNGSTGGAMIHLLCLGIPGSAATAVMMGAFLLHGIQPGPLLFAKQPEQVFTIIAGMIIANIVMIAMGYVAAFSFATLMKVPAAILNTFIIVFCFLGGYALRNDMSDVWLTMLFGILGYVMRRYGLPIAPMVMGLILGPMAEQYFLTSMVANRNDLTIFVTRPVSAIILAAAALLVAWAVGKPILARRRAALQKVMQPLQAR